MFVSESKAKKITIGFITLLILTFWINYSFVLIFRIVDFVVMTFLVWGVLYKKDLLWGKLTLEKKLVIGFFILFFASIGYGLIFIGVVRFVNFVFIYKYVVAFMVFIGCRAVLVHMSEKAIRSLLLLMFVVYIWLIITMYLDVYSPIEWLNYWSYKQRAVRGFSVIRPAFPFTNAAFANGSVFTSDAHNFATYLTNMMVLLVSFLVFKPFKFSLPGTLISIIVLAFTAFAATLSGARAVMILMVMFVALLLVMQFIFMVQKLVKSKRLPDLRKAAMLFVILAVVLVAFWVNKGMITEHKGASALISRSFYLKSLSSERIPKIMEAIDSVVFNGPVIIGIGMPSSHGIWFDNAGAGFIVASGMGGLIVFFGMVATYLLNMYKQARENGRLAEFWCLFSVVGHYGSVNFVSSEFFLTTRSVVPFAIVCGLLTSLIAKAKKESYSFLGIHGT